MIVTTEDCDGVCFGNEKRKYKVSNILLFFFLANLNCMMKNAQTSALPILLNIIMKLNCVFLNV